HCAQGAAGGRGRHRQVRPVARRGRLPHEERPRRAGRPPDRSPGVQGGDSRLHGGADRGGESLQGAEQPRRRPRQRPARPDRDLSRARRRLAAARGQRLRPRCHPGGDGTANQLGHVADARPAAATSAGAALARGSRTARPPAGMVTRWQRMVVVAAAAAAPAAGCKSASAPTQLSPAVTVAKPTSESVADYLDFTGNTAAINSVTVVARVEGYLEKIHFTDGARVKKGQLLFTIQQDQYKAQLAQ